jgi:hypothetical protein
MNNLQRAGSAVRAASALGIDAATTAARVVLLDRWPSGLRRTPGKCVYVKAYREFESHPIRVELTIPLRLSGATGFSLPELQA